MCEEAEEIVDLKVAGAEGHRTILYSAKIRNKNHIDINGYISWLKRNGYGLSNLTTQVEK